MQNMDKWFIQKDLALHQEKAHEWRDCKSDTERKCLTATSEVEELELLPNQSEVGSLLDTNQVSFDEMRRFLFNMYNIQESVITDLG
ncbi:hypothetical protein F8M41_010179 [Gigaspora margarita]|uniref:Uncharacterized protein n=1 Tax=Gigaspora margarita TaxID=4874 RepID=A0A8H4EQD5_GIGMA|nr:hypothetical protein F8M41_010179 [Gigaspora margarita]